MVWFSLPYIYYVLVRWIHCFHIFKKDEPFDFVFLCNVKMLSSFEQTAGKILWKSLFTTSIRQSPNYPSISLNCRLGFVLRESHYMAWEFLRGKKTPCILTFFCDPSGILFPGHTFTQSFLQKHDVSVEDETCYLCSCLFGKGKGWYSSWSARNWVQWGLHSWMCASSLNHWMFFA